MMENLHEFCGTNQVKGEKVPPEEVICNVKSFDLFRIRRMSSRGGWGLGYIKFD